MVAQAPAEVRSPAMPPPEAADNRADDPAHDPADDTAGPLYDSQAMFVAALRDSAHCEPDPLAAIVRLEAAKLHAFGGKYQRVLDAALEQAKSLTDLDDMDPAVKRRLDIHRQCAQYDQLAFKMEQR